MVLFFFSGFCVHFTSSPSVWMMVFSCPFFFYHGLCCNAWSAFCCIILLFFNAALLRHTSVC